MFYRGPGFAGSLGLPYKQVSSGGEGLQSALGQDVCGQSRLLSLELASKQASGHISNELVTFWTTLQEVLSCWVQQYLWASPSEPKLCVELILYYRVWPWENHVCIISAQTKPAVLVLYLETHHSVPQFLPLLSAWAVYTSLHTCSTGKAGSMEKPRFAPPRDFVPCGDPAHLHMVQTGNLHCSDSTKTNFRNCHQCTWVRSPRGSWISASAEIMTALLCPGNDPGLPFILSLRSVGLGNSISRLEQISKRCLWVRAATNALSRTFCSCTALSWRCRGRTSAISAPGRQKTLNQHNESWWETIEASGQHRERESYETWMLWAQEAWGHAC